MIISDISIKLERNQFYLFSMTTNIDLIKIGKTVFFMFVFVDVFDRY